MASLQRSSSTICRALSPSVALESFGVQYSQVGCSDSKHPAVMVETISKITALRSHTLLISASSGLGQHLA